MKNNRLIYTYTKLRRIKKSNNFLLLETKLTSTLTILASVAAGHFFGALIVYLNHRFIFHTKLGNLPLLRQTKKLHLMHHAHAYNEKRNKYIFVPSGWQLIIAIKILLIGIFTNIWFAAGITTFAVLYSYRHYSIHNKDKKSVFFKHHKVHHINPRYNFSGIYPFIDSIFGTSLKKKET